MVLASYLGDQWRNNIALVTSRYGHSSLYLHRSLEIPNDISGAMHVRGVMFHLETDEGFLLGSLAFSRGFQGNCLVFHAEVGFLLFFLLKGFPGIP